MASMTLIALSGELVTMTDPAEIQALIDSYEHEIDALVPDLESGQAKRCKAALDRYRVLYSTLKQIQDQLPAYSAQLAAESTIAQAGELALTLRALRAG